MSDETRVLQIIRNGHRSPALQRVYLPSGAEANLVTLREMARVVREDSIERDLQNFALSVCIGREHTSLSDRINAAFSFCQHGITYREEGEGTETVADLWSCMYAISADGPVGDCAIKSVALATLLSFLKLRPYFVAIGQVPGADYYNHVYVGIGEGKEQMYLDPTPENFVPGQTSRYLKRLNYRIFR